MSIRDSLTGLFNRRYMEQSLVRHLERPKEQQEPLSLIIGDIDYFKGFNDRWGHQAGDVVLKAVSRFLTKSYSPIGYYL
ncbi:MULTISPECIES: diguanylate cyclase [Limnospira]|nr:MULTISPECIES: diguanylate cyclase [Limnospira]MDC0839048.1 diguanylate cyclase [Limnoraphis robusta]MDY7054070.1 diguanylate cyclase [Limnospira fusiformis LS22]UWU48851.1 diguanylate cyclase (GGDEF) domain-containing protein [Arthrospira platensis C1]MDT9198232.1 diguanylate cyclase [Limnospira sp. PMC 1042.18]MDT9273328.1 diguanylate cyclase [Limnospira sp. PMC 737.11]